MTHRSKLHLAADSRHWRLACAVLVLCWLTTAPLLGQAVQGVIWADDPPAKEEKPAGPTTPPVDARKPVPADNALRQRSNRMVTGRMIAAARGVAERLTRHMGNASSFRDMQSAFQSFRLTQDEQEEISLLGFKSVSIEVGGGGNSPYLIGASLSQGVAFSLTPGVAARVITSGGFSVGVPGGAGEIRIGFWKSSVDQLAAWSMGVNASAVGDKGVGVGVGVFWDFSNPPQFDGFNVGATFSKAGVGGDAGLAWTEYTGQIINTVSDIGRVITLQPTAHGKELGGSCKVGTDCKGYLAPVGSKNAGTACCDGVCTQTKKDYLGVAWCPAVCKRSLLAAAGSC